MLSKRHQDEVCHERGEQLRLKAEERRRQQQGKCVGIHEKKIYRPPLLHLILHVEEEMYTTLWEKDRQAKSKREEMEAALQIERNKEMLKVLTLQSAAIEKQKEDMRKLKEEEAQLLVSHHTLCTHARTECMYH